MPGTQQVVYDEAGVAGGTQRGTTVQLNNLVGDVAAFQQGLIIDALWYFFGPGPNSGTSPMKIGSTDTRAGVAAFVAQVQGTQISVAVNNAGTAFGALGVIPASTWGIIAIDVNSSSSISFASGAANYTTGYTTEAAAIAAAPAMKTALARVGYVTIQSNATSFTVGTDSLFGGASGQVAVATNYYPGPIAGVAGGGIFQATGGASPTNPAGYLNLGLWTAPGKNAVIINGAYSRGSTDTRVQTPAITYNCNGLVNIPKAAVAAGTAFGITGTIPASKWGLISLFVDGAGTISYQSAPLNYSTGYGNEGQAKADLINTPIVANKTLIAYVTILASASTWVCGTDALAGGSSGNPATTTNYYPVPSFVPTAGMVAAQLFSQNNNAVINA